MNAVADTLEDLGFVAIPGVATADACEQIARRLGTEPRAGRRDCLEEVWCRELAARLRAHADIAALLPPSAIAVQCTLFDKSEAANWLVAWHQDLSIPVARRVEHAACTGWSVKQGVLHVQPPAAVLGSLVAVRLHLDDCGPENGALRVVPRSHRCGRVTLQAAATLRHEHGEVECTARRGDVLALRPLLLHRSSKATAPQYRRVLHLLFGPVELPCGLEWRSADDGNG